jgi:hypothetical protein
LERGNKRFASHGLQLAKYRCERGVAKRHNSIFKFLPDMKLAFSASLKRILKIQRTAEAYRKAPEGLVIDHENLPSLATYRE